MVDFKFRRGIFCIREMSFGALSDISKGKYDAAYMHSNDTKETLQTSRCIVQRQYTVVNDLQQTEDKLLQNVKKNCKYEIRRAEREGAIYKVFTSVDLKKQSEIVDRFEAVYNKMFASKGLQSYSFNKKLIAAGIQAGAIVISICKPCVDESSEVFHAYLADGKSCVLLYSASPLWNNENKDKAKLIGWMNKYQHWCDILYFKNNGFVRYEWGGIFDPQNPNGIDRFKMEFGGELAQYNNYICANTMLGKLYVALIRLRGRK